MSAGSEWFGGVFASRPAVFRNLARLVVRSISYTSTDDSDISEWLEDNPGVITLSDLRNGSMDQWIKQRIAHHRRIQILRPTPQEQQINAEINIHKWDYRIW